MYPADLPEPARSALAAGLAEEALDPSYAMFVLRHVHVPDGNWRWCCGSACDPCVQRLGRVVDRVREALGKPGNAPPGLPPHPPQA